jgi:hypothetical protein
VRPHARLYKGLPPVKSHKWRWLIVSAAVVIVGWFAFSYGTVQLPARGRGGEFGGGTPLFGGGTTPMFDRYSLVWIGGAFIIGGVLGFTVARRWWSLLVLYAVGFPISFALMWFSDLALGYDLSAAAWGNLFAWVFWIFGVSAGAGVRGLIHHRRVVRTSVVGQPS